MAGSLREVIENKRSDVLARIETAAKADGRTIDDVSLVAVSKVQPDERVDAMLACGQRVFGENRVQEALGRWGPRKDKFPDLKLHLIGPLQTNKAEEAVSFFDVIETLDRLKLAGALAKAGEKVGRLPELFVQVNTGDEPQKSGVSPLEVGTFIRDLEKDFGLCPVGLMCLPPVGEAPGPHFALLAKIAADTGLSKLSMGMSGDYEAAVLMGATQIRVGSALFGDRV